MKQPVICLIAPTASGKTALAYELYDTGNYYLISVDSALIYRDMNIGTAKPTAAELTQYPHALVDIIDPTDHYSVAQFVTDVQTHINLAHAHGKIPLLVGGTMMYYMALLEGINDIPATKLAVRAQVAAMIAEQGIEKVHNFLTQIDPCLGAKFFPTDTQRIGRAVEVYLQTGKPLSQWQAQPNTALADNPNQQWHIVTIMPDRAWLHKRIAQRLDVMWQQGLIAEVIALRQKYPLTADLPSMRCVGYRQTWDYLEKMQPLNSAFGINSTNTYINNTYINDTYINDTCLNLNPKFPLQNHNHTKNRDIEREYRQTLQNEALYATRQLAKRQYTWLRKLTNSPTVAQRVDSLQTFLHIQDARPYLLTQTAFT